MKMLTKILLIPLLFFCANVYIFAQEFYYPPTKVAGWELQEGGEIFLLDYSKSGLVQKSSFISLYTRGLLKNYDQFSAVQSSIINDLDSSFRIPDTLIIRVRFFSEEKMESSYLGFKLQNVYDGWFTSGLDIDLSNSDWQEIKFPAKKIFNNLNLNWTEKNFYRLYVISGVRCRIENTGKYFSWINDFDEIKGIYIDSLGNSSIVIYDDFGGPVTAVEEEVQIPSGFALYQNFPNPFNPATIIEFAVPEAGNYSLIVYDILGQEVVTLVTGQLNAGTHKVSFEASRLASGMYIYKLTGSKVNLTKKMILMK